MQDLREVWENGVWLNDFWISEAYAVAAERMGEFGGDPDPTPAEYEYTRQRVLEKLFGPEVFALGRIDQVAEPAPFVIAPRSFSTGDPDPARNTLVSDRIRVREIRVVTDQAVLERLASVSKTPREAFDDANCQVKAKPNRRGRPASSDIDEAVRKLKADEKFRNATRKAQCDWVREHIHGPDVSHCPQPKGYTDGAIKRRLREYLPS